MGEEHETEGCLEIKITGKLIKTVTTSAIFANR